MFTTHRLLQLLLLAVMMHRVRGNVPRETNTYPPLTTVFTPPPDESCMPTFTYTGSSSGTSLWLDYAVYDGPFTCYPPLWRDEFGTFSPGLCPRAYTTASSFTTSGTMGAICCSSGFEHLGTQIGGWCGRAIPTPTPALWVSDTVTSTLTFTSATGLVRQVVVLWQESDLSVLALATTSAATTTPKSTSPPSSTTPSSTSSTPPEPASSGGLGTAAKAGIGAGVALAALIAAAVLAFFIWKRRRGQQQSAPEQPSVAELPNNPAQQQHMPAEADSGVPEEKKHELAGGGYYDNGQTQQPQVQELSGQPWTAELGGGGGNTHELPVDATGGMDYIPPPQQQWVPAAEPQQQHNEEQQQQQQWQQQPWQSAHMASAQDAEMRWLEEEEARIQARKAQLLMNRVVNS
ncbi:hypothetical protein B0H66DRAFT_631657 [Apodospora peruviana]|uniref:Uncharacterized protein n=1 Tax=Apodospora peruviana TaxID=516989 RepID=A0AAE0HUA7_9PEZI|nr:hypothetical protein B0H66DRAFT_631657 [Apodospora peruviana]